MYYICTILVNPEYQYLIAYIDPGTGSLIIQMLIGGVAAGLIALKVFWGKIRTKFSRNHSSVDTAKKIQGHNKDE